jgi:hypothetical protein
MCHVAAPSAIGSHFRSHQLASTTLPPVLFYTICIMTTSDKTDPLPSAYELILSCSVCQATCVDIYAHPDEVKGLHHCQNGEDECSIKLWLMECGHLTCTAHLEGGGNYSNRKLSAATPDRSLGVPFHSEQDQPKAPCPRCLLDRNDKSLQKLFWVRSWQKDQHDKKIPASWFKTPPMDLRELRDGNMEALRVEAPRCVFCA